MTQSPDAEDERLSSVPRIVPIERMAGEDEEDTALLRQMLEQARKYALSFSWCDSIIESHFGGGIGKIIAIFLFKIATKRSDIDHLIWFIVGDIPPAYLPLEDCGSPIEVFETYLEGMKKWAKLARQNRTGAPSEGVPPMNVPSTPEWAEDVDRRMRLLNEMARPFFE